MPFDKQAFTAALAAQIAAIQRDAFMPARDEGIADAAQRERLFSEAMERRAKAVQHASAEALEHAAALALHALWEDEHDLALDADALLKRADARRQAGDAESLMRAGALLLIAGARSALKE